MANDRKPTVSCSTADLNALLDELLSFGPETENPSTSDFTHRILAIAKQLEEMGKRIDRLSAKL